MPVNADGMPAMFHRRDGGSSGPYEGIKDRLTCFAKRQYASFGEFHRELAGMFSVLGVVRFDVGDVPDRIVLKVVAG